MYWALWIHRPGVARLPRGLFPKYYQRSSVYLQDLLKNTVESPNRVFFSREDQEQKPGLFEQKGAS